MYLDFYQFNKAPFLVAPDPEFLFLSPSHQAALGAIAYGIGSRQGFVMLVGEVGVGKTTILRSYLERVDPQLKIIFVLHGHLTFVDILKTISRACGLQEDTNDTSAWLDSGFYAHPDLTQPKDRIVAYHNIFDPTAKSDALQTGEVASWHGMMTSVVAAGNGHLSEGFYRGIAPDSKLVLVKIGRSGRIPDQDIERGLQWILDHREEHNIRIVNISAGGDFEQAYFRSSLCKTVERAVSEGLVVVCAVGNAGMAPGHPVLPPASSPSAISVGGLDDQNSLDRARRGMYRSSYGPTIDGLQKPEVIAPGIWVAAPILPHTPTADEAKLYSALDDAADDQLLEIIEAHPRIDKDLYESRELPIALLRQLITIKLHEGNVINQHYKYVDGTSFSSPIVASIVACMLEANPGLTPQKVKRILIKTAERVSGIEVDRQGWGVVVPARAVAAALDP